MTIGHTSANALTAPPNVTRDGEIGSYDDELARERRPHRNSQVEQPKPWRVVMDTQSGRLKVKDIQALIREGGIRKCAACRQLSAYAWQYVTAKPSYSRGCFSRGEIAHIGAASCFEWECGHCGANNVFRSAPILAECYTHVPLRPRTGRTA